ncbi:MAG: TetR/AcrR family transcriptional regulator [Sulfuricella denitrificans]|nr:TetR/AcrR family transcriptional regulator [Sulfuricella denitrificans]
MQVNSKHLPADERRTVTVETVVELAAEQNPSDITTAAIARKMNLTQGALFRHFPSKDAIWQAVMEWVAERLMARVDQAADTAASPLAALEAVFMAHIEFVSAHPGVPRMLFGELQRPADSLPKRVARTLIRRYAERLSGLIEAGKTCGELDARVNAGAASTLFIGMIQGLVMQSMLAGNTRHMQVEAPNVFEIYRRGIEVAR